MFGEPSGFLLAAWDTSDHREGCETVADCPQRRHFASDIFYLRTVLSQDFLYRFSHRVAYLLALPLEFGNGERYSPSPYITW